MPLPTNWAKTGTKRNLSPGAKESVEKDILEQVAKILKVPTEAIENFDEEQAINVIANTFHDEAFIGNSGGTYHINPIEKLFSFTKKNRPYERMLKEKDEMMARLERLIGNNFNK